MLNFKNLAAKAGKGAWVLSLLFYGAAAIIVLKVPVPSLPPLPQKLAHDYLSGEEKAFIPVGAEFRNYSNMLPPEGPLTFIMNVPFSPYAVGIAKLYEAQAYLTPMILNPQPEEKIAIIYCDNHFIADLRMQETGYRLVAVAADGKGMAVKK